MSCETDLKIALLVESLLCAFVDTSLEVLSPNYTSNTLIIIITNN